MKASPPSAAPQWSLVKRDSGAVVAGDLRIADGYWTKMAGLQFRKTLPVGRALILVKISSVHTFWMRFALDLTFIGVDGDVLQVQRGIKPWRITVGPKGTRAILESKAGWIETEPGDRLMAVCPDTRELRRRAKSLSIFDPVAAHGEDREHSRHTESEHQHAET